MSDMPKIETITICTSSKFYEAAQKLAAELTEADLNIFTPRFDFNENVVAVTMVDKIRLTREFLRKIDKSDAIYIIDQDGYTGRSVCIEMATRARSARRCFSPSLPTENAVRALATEVIPISKITKRVRP